MIVLLLAVAGCLLITAGFALALGTWAALIVAGVCCVAGAYVTDHVL